MVMKNIEDIYPLSPMQQGILFHDLYDPEQRLYFMQIAWEVKGEINFASFEAAWQQVVERHPALRTVFLWEELDEPLQIVLQNYKLAVELEDWRGVEPGEREGRLRAWLRADKELGFKLAAAPPMRVALIQTSENTYYLVWSFHHLLLDGWSASIVHNEVFFLYEASRRGERLKLPPTRPFRDYIAWLQKQDSTRAEAYWREALAGVTAPTSLAAASGKGEPAPAASRVYRHKVFTLSEETTAALQALARRRQLTLNTLVQGAWALVLSRYSGERDVVFGVTVSGRPATLAGGESMVGMFVNTLPLRAKVRSREPLLQWLAQLQKAQAEMRRYEFSSLVEVQGWSDVPRGVQLFESFVTFENLLSGNPAAEEGGGGFEIRNLGILVSDTGYPLSVVVEPAQKLDAHILYDTGLFDEETVEQVGGYFLTLLERMSADPQQTLAELTAPDEAERRRLLVEWNRTAADYPRDDSVAAEFERQAARDPDAVALVFGQRQMTYGELNRRANQLAHHLRLLGIGPETAVAICVERSLEMVVGLLGILKAGGYYVPLDPASPLRRVEAILEDVRPSVVLTQQHLTDFLPSSLLHVIALDADWQLIAAEGEENPAPAASGDNLAYVIYTSGSTGRPKGVGATHRGVMRLVKGTDFAALDAAQVFLQLAPLSFDASTFELWGSLLNGARLVIMPPEAPTLEGLGAAIERHGVTTLWLTAGLFHLAVAERIGMLRPLGQLLAGGDVLAARSVRRVLSELDGCQLINGYGPTECTTFACCYRVPREGFAGERTPIGRPIANTEVYVLDECGEPVPVGVVGELYVGGDGLARGYQGQPALTAERFVPHPFSAEPGARLYRTGDLVRYLPDGLLEFLGRRDSQVKIRGFRIEPGEVEAALARHPLVREAVVMAREDSAGDKHLVAYVVGHDGESPGGAELRAFLGEQLPDYMMPAHFVALDALPLTPNGKVDRRRLPEPEARDDADFVAPRTPTEEKLAAVWAEVIGCPRVGAEDNFFELGGHSLLATQVVSRLVEPFGVELPLRVMFESRTLAELAAHIDELRGSAGRRHLPPPIVPIARDGELPLSFAQQRLWFLNQLDPLSAFYNIPFAVRMVGSLDVAALERTLNEIIRRHEALRTTFSAADGRPVQVIHDSLSLRLEAEEVEGDDASERERRALAVAREEASRPFDLGAGPLLRARLLRLGEEDHLALLTMHHIVSDGWSMGVLIKEVAALYEAFSQERPSPLPELKIQYADFAAWQRDWLRGEVLEEQLEYWRQQLAGAQSSLDMPTDYPRPAVQTFEGGTVSQVLDASLTERLKSLSQSEGVTPFMTLLAAFMVLLHRYTGQEDISVGSPVANRTRAETEELIGFFVNTLVMRAKVEPGESFQALLRRVREVTLGAYAHQDVPFEKLVEELQPERDLSRSPLFQVMLVLQNAPLGALELPGLRLSSVDVESATEKFDITLTLTETAEGLSGAWTYNTHLFEAETVRRMADHWRRLLESVVADPLRRASDLDMVSERELHQSLVEWNQTRAEFPETALLHELFEAQAAATPEAAALVFGEEELSYRRLNQRAERLARHLRRKGVGPESLVGVLMERSPELVVALLGVLKAGGAYVPLDPDYPRERLRFMLEDSRAGVLLTQRRLLDGLGWLDGREVEAVAVDELAPEGEGEEALGEAAVAPENLAYVIYTSGSTGRPKGVAITHRSAAVLVHWALGLFTPAELSGVLASTSVCFDLSIFELFAPLSCGGCVVLARNALELPELAARGRVTLVNTVPSAMTELVRLGGLPGSVRSVNLAGEPLTRRLVESVYASARVERVFNLYGPTEDTTYSTGALVQRGASGAVTIGRPISETRVYLLDGAGRPVPIGVPGELYLGGKGLARGYLGRPGLTAERFVPDPFSGEPGARLYRTGDLARWLPDGEIDFLGRIDHQVKVRGYRIELGEIEAALAEHERVSEAVVVARREGAEEARLVAYVVPQVGGDGAGVAELNVEELRRHLRGKLPEYMVPSAFVVLAELPLTPNGKVDRRRLPEPEAAAPHSEGGYEAPRDSVEEMLAGIWADVLGLPRVGVNDNFFELGGHSLLATQVVARVRDVFRVELSLRRLFETPTVAGLARTVESLMSGGHLRVPPVRPVAHGPEIPLSFAQQRMWFLHQWEEAGAAYHVAWALRVRGRLDVAALEWAFNEVVRRHDTLRTTFHLSGGQPVQVIEPFRPFEIQLTELEQVPASEREAEATRQAVREARRRFDLESGPVLRVGLWRLGAEDHLLAVVIHHIAADGWSMGVLVREVATLYEARVTKTAAPLEELAVSYADYAVWQREWLQGEALDEQLEYWRRQLAGSPPGLDLPTDFPRKPEQSFRGAQIPLDLPGELVARLDALGRRVGTTLFMTLLAAFQTLLYRYTGQDDIITGVPIANRRQRDLEGLIGFFVNTLALRTDLSGSPTFVGQMRRVREAALGAYAHQDVPFEKLVEELQPGRDPSRNPLFQTLFVFQNVPFVALESPGLSFEPRPFDTGSTRFDLELHLWEEQSGGLRGLLVFDADLFEERTIRQMRRHFETLLEGIARAPEQPIDALPLLTEAEESELLSASGPAPAAFPRGQCVHHLFEEQAARTPDAVAVTHAGRQLSYAQLNGRANQLARHLRGMGVKTDDVVAVMVGRSIEMTVSILGVLKAGAAYVPLDPEYPADRLAFMLEDAGAAVLLTQQSLVPRLPADVPRVLCVDADAAWADESTANPAADVAPENLCYVIYTSGSTGRPKAVAMPHLALVNMLHWQLGRAEATLPHPPRTLQFAPVSFDVSFQEMFSTWGAGATLVLIDEDARRDTRELLRVVRAEQVERLYLPVVALKYLAELSEAEGVVPESLRQVIAAGEQLKITGSIRALFGKLEGCTLDNHYGPSETHAASAFLLEGAADEWPELPPVGRPITGARLYVLDRRMRPVPRGVAGELYIGGELLARGYLNRPAATAERFIPDPFGDEPGARLYRTGDLCRYLPDGNLRFLGRRDFQMKVRGFRIEAGEVEAALRRHAGVREAVVTTRENARGEKQLVAYLMADGGPGWDTDELRRRLEGELPAYMIPSAFVLLEEFPLTPSGKIDRRALPTPAAFSRDAVGGYVPPRTPYEELLAGIWAETLGRDRVGSTDNFFDLGGHSLLATQVISSIRDSFGVELPLRTLFGTPTLAALAATVEAEARGGRSSASRDIVPAERTGRYPLSFTQQRLWFLNRLEPANPFYNVSAAVRMRGRLDHRSLEAALSEVVRRHEALRTTFADDGQEPVQVVGEPAPVNIDLLDISADADPERHAAELARQEAEAPFDLSTGPLLRARLLRLGGEDHLALLTMHHIVSDGWSMSVLLREIAALYGAFSQGRPSPLPELPLQYADFALWQRERLRGEALDEQLEYWRRQLADAPKVLELPTDHPRPPLQQYRGATFSFTVEAELAAALARLGRREGATLFMTLLAAFDVLLSRYTRQHDILVGSPIANRNRTETENLIGAFVNTLVLRTKLSPGDTFAQLLARVREMTLGAYEHQDLPFEKLVEELQPERDMSRSPLFQVMFTLQNTPREPLSLPGLTLTPSEVEHRTAKFDLMLTMDEGEGGALLGWFEYNTGLFDGETIERMCGHFQTLLRAVAAEPGRKVAALPLMGEEERRALAAWNDTRVDYEHAGESLHGLFERQAAATPDAVAVISEEASLTYAELNARANRLARHLRSLGVGPEARVALLMERSAEMVVALLGILKAGGAYVPLDLDYPAERLRFMLEDSGARLLLTESSAYGAAPASAARARVLLLDERREEISQLSGENLPPSAEPDNLAYVIYTSGSTGRPKGAMLAHREVVNCLLWMQQTYRLGERDRFLFKTTLNFDPSVWEVFWPLAVGAGIFVARPGGQQDAAYLAEVIRRRQVTIAYFVPAMLSPFLDEPTAARAESLRKVFCGGEPLAAELVERFYAALPGAELHHSYGPTETAIGVTKALCPREGLRRVTPIGRPVANTRLYVLDADMVPLPVGVVGELYVGGTCVGRGYLGRPALTAERFVPDPFSDEPGARLYRTGDLARYLPDGQLEFRGRADAQVKLRGVRIEPGEVEAALREHPSVAEAAVVVREDLPGGAGLVGYVVAGGAGAAPGAQELREHLSARLPRHMVPAAFVELERLPLMPNGKVDRGALPAPGVVQRGDAGGYVAARGAVEELIAGAWAEVLGLERVGLNDNFFDLGGHSLLATQVVSRVRQALGVEIPLRRMFEAPTVAAMAESVRAAMAAEEGQAQLPPIEPAPRTGEVPLSFEQQRLWLWDQFNPGSTIYNLTHAFLLRGRLNVAALEQSLGEIVRRHETLRTTFQEGRDEPVQVVGEWEPVTLSVTDLSHMPAEEQAGEVERLVGAQAHHVFDLSRGPLLLFSLLRLNEAEHLAVVTIHHIVYDGWSMGVLAHEVATLYEAFDDGRPSPLEELPIQYTDFAVWQRRWMESEGQKKELDYWKARLVETPLQALELPFDHPRPPVMSFRGAALPVSLPGDLTAELRALSRREGVTLYMTLLAAFKTLLHRYSSQTDIVVGADVANRNHVETEKLIGFFVNMLVLRTDLSGDPTFRELLGRVRETTLGAYAHQHIPYAKLVTELNVKREWNRNPLFQAVFVLQNAPLGELEMPGLTLSPMAIETDTAPFDMVLSLGELGGGLEGALLYSTELFDRATMERLLVHYRNVLESIVADPGERLSELRLLPREQTQDYNRFAVMSGLSQKELENLILEINEVTGGD